MVDSTCSPAPSYRKVDNGACNYMIRLTFPDFGPSLALVGIPIEFD